MEGWGGIQGRAEDFREAVATHNVTVAHGVIMAHNVIKAHNGIRIVESVFKNSLCNNQGIIVIRGSSVFMTRPAHHAPNLNLPRRTIYKSTTRCGESTEDTVT